MAKNLLLTEDIKYLLSMAFDYYCKAELEGRNVSVLDTKRLDDARTWLQQQATIRKEITDVHNA